MNSLSTFEKILLGIALAAFAVIYSLFYPPIFAYRDEANYFSMAYALRQGSLSFPIHQIPVQAFFMAGEKVVPVYPWGQAFALIPFTLGGWQGIFSSGLIWHLAGVWLILKLADLFKTDLFWAALFYLFYPPFILYSRTLMTDIPSTVLTLAAAYFYFKPSASKLWAGLFFGLNYLLRTSNILVVIPFGAAVLFQAVRSRKFSDLISFCLGFLPCMAIQFGLQGVTYGDPFKSGYTGGASLSSYFSLEPLGRNLLHYLSNLLLCYPLMLALFIFSKPVRRVETVSLLFLLLGFFSFYYFYDAFPGKFLTTFFGNRFLFPVIPFLLLSYGDYFGRLFEPLPPLTRKALSVLAVAVLSFGCFMISGGHQQALERQARMKEAIYAHTPPESLVIYDNNTAELLQAAWGKRTYLLYPDFKDKLFAMAEAHDRQGIYLVKRDFQYADKGLIAGLTEEDLVNLAQTFEIRPVAEAGEVSILSLELKRETQA